MPLFSLMRPRIFHRQKENTRLYGDGNYQTKENRLRQKNEQIDTAIFEPFIVRVET